MKRSLAWLALIGALLYTVTTWPFADAISVLGSKDQNSTATTNSEARTGPPASGPSLATTPVSDVAVRRELTEKPEAQGTASGAVQAERLVVRTAAIYAADPHQKAR